jgi:hypothetical protein
MSTYLHYAIARAQQQEIDARVSHAHHAQDRPESSRRPRRGGKFRLGQAAAAIGACAAISTALVATEAPASTPPGNHDTHFSAQRFNTEIRALERKGFVQYSCTLDGTEMRSPSTGQVVTVSLRG